MNSEMRAATLYAGTDPAANVEVAYTVPTLPGGQNGSYSLLAFTVSLVADANAANRRVHLTIERNSVVWFRTSCGTDHTANQTIVYSFAPGAGAGTIVASASAFLSIPTPTIVRSGDIIKTITTNRQVTDNYGAPAVLLASF